MNDVEEQPEIQNNEQPVVVRKRGRPRKDAIPVPEVPKVVRPIGRPRKYERIDDKLPQYHKVNPNFKSYHHIKMPCPNCGIIIGRERKKAHMATSKCMLLSFYNKHHE